MQTKQHPLLINLHKHVFMKKTDLGYQIEDEKINVSKGYSEPKTTYFKQWELIPIAGAIIMILFLFLIYSL